jgi:RNA polymerase sigma-70 factor (ECF subfamily)
MEVEEINIVSRLKNDDCDAYKVVFRTFYPDLYNRAYKYTFNKEDAKDLVQSTFIKLWLKRKELIDDKPVEPLLFTIHKNNCLDYLKLRKASISYLAGDPLIDIYTETPLDQYVSGELEVKIDRIISDLPSKCREIFEFSRNKGLKYAEIAEKLNISVKTVEHQISIALDRLRKKLIEYMPLLIVWFM